MATSLTTEQYYNGTGSQTNFAFTFPYTKESDVKVEHPIGTVLTPKAGSTANDYEFLTATTIKFTTAPGSGTANVKIYRATNVDSAKAIFASGSTIRASDLNTVVEHVLFSKQDKVQTADITDQAVTAAKIKNDTITAAQLATDSVGALELADNSVASANIIDGSIVNADINASAAIAGTKISPNFGSQNIVTSGTVDGRDVSADGAKLDGIEAGATGDQTNAEIRAAVEAASDSNIFTDADHSKLNAIEANATADQTNAEIRAAVEAATDSNVFTDADHSKLNAIEASATADQTSTEIKSLLASDNLTSAHLAADSVGTSEIANDAVTGAKINADSIDSEHYVDSSIDTQHIAILQITTDRIANDAVDNTKIATDAVNRDSIEDGEVIRDKIADLAINTAKIVDDAVTYVKMQDASATNKVLGRISSGGGNIEELTGANVRTIINVEDGATADQTAAEIKTAYESNADTNPLTDTEKAVIDGVTANTSELNILDGVTSSTAELNLLDGKSIVTSIASNANDSQLPSAQAVNERIVELVTEVGGFVPIANEVSFPNTNPDVNDGAGTIVSIADAGGVVVNGSGVSTTGRTVGGSTVTINGIDSSLNNTTIAAGQGMLVETTTTLNTYTYHRLVVDEAGVANAKAAVDDFNNRYRVGSTNPTSSLDDGDLFFNTSTDKMLVYNSTGNSWDEVQSVGNFFINTLSSSSGSPGTGGSATFNNSANRFTLSNAGTYAQQHIVSINGVIQKPNSGTSVPSEGFAIDGSDILFSSAPATGSDYFIITVGASVNIGAPSNNTVTSAMIVDGTITGGDIASDTITEDKLDIHAAPSGTNRFLGYTSNGMEWAVPPDTNTQVGGATGVDFNDNVKVRFGAGNDLQIWHDASGGNYSYIFNYGAQLLKIGSDQNIVLGKTSNENYIIAKPDNAVELYYDNSKKFNTYSGGVQVTGLKVLDSDKLKIGNAEDLQIFHSSGENFIRGNSSTSPLYIDCCENLHIRHLDTDGSNSETMIKAVGDGAVELYYDNSKKLETTSSGATVNGTLVCSALNAPSLVANMATNGYNIQVGDSTSGVAFRNRIKIGDGDDLQLYHNESHSYIADTGTGDLFILSDDLHIGNAANTEDMAVFEQDGGVKLYYNNTKKFETYNNGCIIFGSEGGAGYLNLYADEGDDNADKWRFAALTDGYFELQNYASGSWEKNIRTQGNGHVSLYCDNVKKFETTSTGVDVSGNVKVFDGNKILCGHGGDLEIFHDGSHSYITNAGTGRLYINADQINLHNKAVTENMLKAVADGSVELYYNGTKKFETLSNGIKAHGTIYTESAGSFFKSNQLLFSPAGDAYIDHYATGRDIYFRTSNSSALDTTAMVLRSDGSTTHVDNIKTKWGTHDDLEIFHDGSNSYIKDTGTGVLAITGSQIDLYNAASNETMLQAYQNGAVKLRYDNSTKLQTESWGVRMEDELGLYDNKKLFIGTSNDLQIYHDGSNSYLSNGTGELLIRAKTGENSINCNPDGSVELYHDNSKKVETTSGGINVTGAITVNGSALSSGLFESVARYSEQTNGSSGTFSSGDWRTRALNTEEYDPDGIGSLSSWQITLAAGTYYAQWRAPAYRAHRHVTRLWNVTDGSQIGAHGQAGFSPSGGDTANGYSHGAAWFTISGSKAIRLEHRCQTSRSGNGFGVHGNVTPHTFAAIDIFKAS